MRSAGKHGIGRLHELQLFVANCLVQQDPARLCSNSEVEQQAQRSSETLEELRQEAQQYEKELDMFRELASDLKSEKARAEALQRAADEHSAQAREAQGALSAHGAELERLRQEQVLTGLAPRAHTRHVCQAAGVTCTCCAPRCTLLCMGRRAQSRSTSRA